MWKQLAAQLHTMLSHHSCFVISYEYLGPNLFSGWTLTELHMKRDTRKEPFNLFLNNELLKHSTNPTSAALSPTLSTWRQFKKKKVKNTSMDQKWTLINNNSSIKQPLSRGRRVWDFNSALQNVLLKRGAWKNPQPTKKASSKSVIKSRGKLKPTLSSFHI